MAWSWKNLFGFGGDESRNKNEGGTPQFEFQPYGGLRPPRIDSPGQEILRPTQKQIFDILMRRSRGEDVGYDPARKTAAISLFESKLGKQREDDVREAEGRVAASGLGGNLRAQEALTGRVNRDYGRTLGEGINALNIEDLTRANEERDINTERLRALNQFNFGQENKGADFDLDVYGAEQQNRRFGASQALEGYQLDSGRSDEESENWWDTALNIGALIPGPQQPFVAGAAGVNSLMRQSGQGIAPQDWINTSSGPGVRKPMRALKR